MTRKIAIVGSGTSGLAAAAFLRRDGLDVTLFERFEHARPLGAGIMLQPTGLAVLACLGLDEAALASGARITNLHGQVASGATVFDIRYGDLSPQAFGLGIHRGALFHLLHNAVLGSGAAVVTGCEIVQSYMTQQGRMIANTQGHDYGPFDLVVDASGGRSRLRGSNDSDFHHHRAYPYGAVWGVCSDPDQAFGRGYLRQRYDGAQVMIGALAIGKRPLDGIDTLAFFWSLRADSYASWRAGNFSDWQQRVTDYWPEMTPFVSQFTQPDDLTFAQYSDSIMRRWYGDGIVHIGDAAHCTSPQLGQGANLGLIDALTLSVCLREHAVVNDALRALHDRRWQHVHFYQIASRWLTPFFQSDSRAAAWLRDRSFGLMCKMPYVKTQMLRTLAGVKTGVFTQLDPGQWHSNYSLRSNQPR